MNEPMKLIEGMKKLKIYEKQMERNSLQIQQNASAPSNEIPPFGTPDAQRDHIKGLVQANTDLLSEYLHLKQRVDMTSVFLARE